MTFGINGFPHGDVTRLRKNQQILLQLELKPIQLIMIMARQTM